jgi:hypothetical protein
MLDPSGQIDRRMFLSLVSAALWTAAKPAISWRNAEWTTNAGLTEVFSHRKSAIEVGRRYLSRYPEDTWPLILARDLGRTGGGGPRPARAALRARIRRDFELGNTVLLDGWILGRSECQACAALALAVGAAAAGAAS